MLDLLGSRPPVPAGRPVGAGDGRQARDGYDVSVLIDRAGLGQPAHERACHGRSMWLPQAAEASVSVARACEGEEFPPATFAGASGNDGHDGKGRFRRILERLAKFTIVAVGSRKPHGSQLRLPPRGTPGGTPTSSRNNESSSSGAGSPASPAQPAVAREFCRVLGVPVPAVTGLSITIGRVPETHCPPRRSSVGVQR
jgi:hypothetical protein